MTDRSLIKDAAEHARRSNPQADTDRLAAIRAEFERTTHPDWRDTTDFGWLLARVDQLTTDLAQAHADINSNAGLFFEARDHAKQAEAERDEYAARMPLICCSERHAAKVRGLEARASRALALLDSWDWDQSRSGGDNSAVPAAIAVLRGGPEGTDHA